MTHYKQTVPENFQQMRWLDKYMAGHKGFIAGGCFKNILSGERVKDIDIFFESSSDQIDAEDYFNSHEMVKQGWKFKYRNEKVTAFQKEGEKVWVELIQSVFGTPEEILRQFDFTVAKMVYFKKEITVIQDHPFEAEQDEPETKIEYHILHHADFFEHLHMKRLVLDENIPFPVSTWERSYKYKGYGYNLCRESKIKLLEALQKVNPNDVGMGLYGGWD